MVPVHVPFTRSLGSTEIVSSVPSGGTTPDDGMTASHGRSGVAMNETGPLGRPGMKIWNTTGVVLPFGTTTLKRGAVGFGTGMMTTLAGVSVVEGSTVALVPVTATMYPVAPVTADHERMAGEVTTAPLVGAVVCGALFGQGMITTDAWLLLFALFVSVVVVETVAVLVTVDPEVAVTR